MKGKGDWASDIGPLDIFLRAVQSVQRNLSALAVYLVITVGSSTLATVVNNLVTPPGSPPAHGSALIYELALNAFLVLTAAAAQAIVFARMGKEMDRPLWKIGGDREALRRYFPLWAVLNAVIMIFNLLAFEVPAYFEEERLGFIPFWMLIVAVSAYIPLGTAIMFHRGFEWRKLGEGLTPLRRQLGKTLLVMLAGAILFFFYLSLLAQTDSQRWLRPVIDVIYGYFDCVLFSATWIICIFERQMPPEIDLDF